MPLHTKILIGFLVGLVAGLIVHFAAADAEWLQKLTTYGTQPIGDIFLRLLFMLVIPLLFSALVIGVSDMGDIRSLGRIGWRTLAYTAIVSTIAVLIGMFMVNLVKPGVGVDPVLAERLIEESAERAQEIVQASREGASGIDMLVQIVPDNVFRAAATNDVLAVMFFALMFGIGLVLVREHPGAKTLRNAIEGLFEVMMKLINLVIRFAPIAVACLMFNLAALFGWDLLVKLGAYAGVVLASLALHFFVVYPLAVKYAGGMSPKFFFRGVQEAIVVAFSTASSNATLPTALKVADENLRLPRRISRFVLTVGATANQNGTALFEGVTVLFLAQFFNVPLTIEQQFLVMLVCILGGIGTAGVPAGSLPVIAMICGMIKVPPEGIALILGVNHFLDMSRTVLNVTGDLTAAVVVSRGEKDEDATDAVVVRDS